MQQNKIKSKYEVRVVPSNLAQTAAARAAHGTASYSDTQAGYSILSYIVTKMAFGFCNDITFSNFLSILRNILALKTIK